MSIRLADVSPGQDALTTLEARTTGRGTRDSRGSCSRRDSRRAAWSRPACSRRRRSRRAPGSSSDSLRKQTVRRHAMRRQARRARRRRSEDGRAATCHRVDPPGQMPPRRFLASRSGWSTVVHVARRQRCRTHRLPILASTISADDEHDGRVRTRAAVAATVLTARRRNRVGRVEQARRWTAADRARRPRGLRPDDDRAADRPAVHGRDAGHRAHRRDAHRDHQLSRGKRDPDRPQLERRRCDPLAHRHASRASRRRPRRRTSRCSSRPTRRAGRCRCCPGAASPPSRPASRRAPGRRPRCSRRRVPGAPNSPTPAWTSTSHPSSTPSRSVADNPPIGGYDREYGHTPGRRRRRTAPPSRAAWRRRACSRPSSTSPASAGSPRTPTRLRA